MISFVTRYSTALGWAHDLALPLLLLPGFAHVLSLQSLLRLTVVTAALLSLPLLKLLAQYDALAFVQAGINLAVALGLFGLLLAKARTALRPSPQSL